MTSVQTVYTVVRGRVLSESKYMYSSNSQRSESILCIIMSSMFILTDLFHLQSQQIRFPENTVFLRPRYNGVIVYFNYEVHCSFLSVS